MSNGGNSCDGNGNDVGNGSGNEVGSSKKGIDEGGKSDGNSNKGWGQMAATMAMGTRTVQMTWPLVLRPEAAP